MLTIAQSLLLVQTTLSNDRFWPIADVPTISPTPLVAAVLP